MPPLTSDDPRLQQLGKIGFDTSLPGVELVSIGEGQAEVRMLVQDSVQNWYGTLHGGAIATLVDNVGTLAIMAADREGRAGVTTDLNVSYFSAAPSGSVIRVAGRTVKSGLTLAFVEVDLFLETEGERGKHLAQGRMTKFMGR
ncbi:MAG: PaaI family thioesterase [Planctomycetes bacterium]|nr:PaaI family thioesterase [Planctomycetota bacterium]